MGCLLFFLPHQLEESCLAWASTELCLCLLNLNDSLKKEWTMSTIKGFLYLNPKHPDPLPDQYIFDRIKRGGIPIDEAKSAEVFSGKMEEFTLFLHSTPQFTLGIGPDCDLIFLNPLRTGYMLYVFEINREEKTLVWQFGFGRMTTPKETISLKEKPSFWNYLRGAKSENALVPSIELALQTMLQKHPPKQGWQKNWLQRANFILCGVKKPRHP